MCGICGTIFGLIEMPSIFKKIPNFGMHADMLAITCQYRPIITLLTDIIRSAKSWNPLMQVEDAKLTVLCITIASRMCQIKGCFMKSWNTNRKLWFRPWVSAQNLSIWAKTTVLRWLFQEKLNPEQHVGQIQERKRRKMEENLLEKKGSGSSNSFWVTRDMKGWRE